jgi:hypothetical protein
MLRLKIERKLYNLLYVTKARTGQKYPCEAPSVCKANSQWQGQPRDSVHVHGKSMSKDALNKVRYVCLSNCLND